MIYDSDAWTYELFPLTGAWFWAGVWKTEPTQCGWQLIYVIIKYNGA